MFGFETPAQAFELQELNQAEDDLERLIEEANASNQKEQSEQEEELHRIRHLLDEYVHIKLRLDGPEVSERALQELKAADYALRQKDMEQAAQALLICVRISWDRLFRYWDFMGGHLFETRIGWLLRKAGQAVLITPPAKDGGIDGFVIDEGEKFLMACRARNRTQGIGWVRDFNNRAWRHPWPDRTLMVSLSGFSSEAQAYATERSIRLLDFERILGLQKKLGGVGEEDMRLELVEQGYDVLEDSFDAPRERLRVQKQLHILVSNGECGYCGRHYREWQGTRCPVRAQKNVE